MQIRETEDLIGIAGDDQRPGGFRIAGGASFLSFGDRNAVFSERAQRIYGLNHLASYIWCGLEEGRTPSAIANELAERGVNPRLATRCVRQAVRMWLRQGLLKVDFDAGREIGMKGFSVNVGKLMITIHAGSAQLAQQLIPLFGDEVLPVAAHGEIFHVVEIDRLIHVFHNGASVVCSVANELVPAIKAYITEQVVAASAPDVVFHAACLVRDARSILISGAPGAGKTTLALHLMHAGLGYRSDDIVMIGPDGNAAGIPFSPALKPGAWDIVNKLYPELDDVPIHRRPDGKRVRYLRPARVAPGNSYPVGLIIFIKRLSDGPAKLVPLGQMMTLQRVMEGALSADGKLTHAACLAIKRTLSNARSFQLTYSNVVQAADAIMGLRDD